MASFYQQRLSMHKPARNNVLLAVVGPDSAQALLLLIDALINSIPIFY
jgi:hypothetical protein